ncbi:PRC-barrel domain-containing protein [Algoriphagus sp. H41]|uniref:PRC-barrel domain-containing protein n=1 Tax=Algoriphagus oliviformis TaxID=2811231 RepID=A0ABS3C4V2_9BACT|nr:PRC-barrel domain-containing protein [Algoriphagus oliviformis]MBN7811875.1 PRC-barrel domain-containing protein [Algoriphagus oliviformis]
MNSTNHSQISCTTAMSCTVKTSSDQSVGAIKEFMINTSTGQVDYVVLKVDEGFLNLGSKLLAMPMESFHFHAAHDGVITVRESKETLENAPGFDEDNWPTGPQSEFIHTLRSYYAEEPRSLFGRYDRENRIYFDQDERFDLDSRTAEELRSSEKGL